MIKESARDIPVVYDVDVAIIGGSTAAVTAAVEAAKTGASVFLAAPRTYLGEDLCATYRLWLEPAEKPDTDLAKALFAPPPAAPVIGEGLPFTYEADLPSAEAHKDKTPPRILCDGKGTNGVTESVQYDGDASIVLDFGKEAALGMIHILAFQRNNDIEIESATVSLSNDKTNWNEAATLKNAELGQGERIDSAVHLHAPLTGTAQFVKVSCRRPPTGKRILLGEIVVEPAAAKPRELPKGPAIPPMPMQIKSVLDNTLLEAGVTFLFGCYPTDVLVDESGRVAGFIMANRNGRQAVRAKTVIDATPRAAIARIAGAKVRGSLSGKQTFSRVVIGEAPSDSPMCRVKPLPSPVQTDQGGSVRTHQDAFECLLDIPMKDDSFASFAEAEQLARDLTWTPKLVMASENLFQVPPDAIEGQKRLRGPWRGAAKTDLAAFRPKSREGLLVLGGCADVSREAAAAMLRPLEFMKLGARIGRAAADDAAKVQKSATVQVRAAKPEGAAPGEVRETLSGIRPIQTGLPIIRSEERGLPVLGRYDVVVIGGGTGGAPAGIGAARQGARTLVVEYLDGLGGIGTLGLIGTYYYGYCGGFTGEMDKAVATMDGKDHPVTPSWNVEWKMEWYRRELRKAGADIWFGALGCGAVVDNGRVIGAVVATPLGRGVVLANTVIDSTGNADVAFAASAETMTTGAAHVGVQGTGMPPRLPGAHYTNTDYTITDDGDVLDAWRTFVSGRSKFSGSYDLAQIIDSRERRRIVGDFIISPLDIWNKRTYPDTIGISRSNFDTHGFTVHAMFALKTPDKEEVFANTPFRALLPKGLDGILVTGLGISAHRDAMPILRMQPDIQNQGYAAGVAGAMAAKANTTVRNIDVKQLQRHLVEIGNIPQSALNDRDSYPMPLEPIQAAVQRVANDYDGIPVILAQPEEALPLLRDAYAKAPDEKARLIYAHILGMMGDPSGAETLFQALNGKLWDEGWSFSGMGQFGGSISPVDSQLIALARTGDPRALKVAVDKAGELDASSAFSHHRAVAIALETIGNPEGAAALAKLLEKPGMTGYACTDIAKAREAAALANPNLDRDRSIRELVLARALYRCGDVNGLGERILNEYAFDFRGHLARHATAILIKQAPDTRELDIEGLK